MPSYLLGHDVGPDRTDRPQAVVVGNIVRGAPSSAVTGGGAQPRTPCTTRASADGIHGPVPVPVRKGIRA